MLQTRPEALKNDTVYWLPLAYEDGYLELEWQKNIAEIDGYPRYRYPVPKDVIFFSKPLKKNIPTDIPDYLVTNNSISYLKKTRQYLIFDGRYGPVPYTNADKIRERPSAMWAREKCRRAWIITVPDRVESLCLPPWQGLHVFSLTRHGIIGVSWSDDVASSAERGVYFVEGQSLTRLLDIGSAIRNPPRTSPNGCRLAVITTGSSAAGTGGRVINVIDICDGKG